MAANRSSDSDRRTRTIPVDNNCRNGQERRALLGEFDQTAEKLKKIGMFRDLTKEQLTKMIRICTKRSFPAHERIYKMGEASTDMFIVIKGKLNVTFETGYDLQSIVPTGTVGEMGIFTGEKRSASIVTATDCVMLHFRKKEMYELFRTDTDLWIKVLMNIISDLSLKIKKDYNVIEDLLMRVRCLEMI